MPNRSTIRTKKAIKHAFSELIEEKGLETLTVSDIARSAGINRGTFYLHYVDKDDLKQQLEKESIVALREILFNVKSQDPDDPIEVIPYEGIVEGLRYLRDDLAFIKAIIGPHGDRAFLAGFRESLGEMIEKQISSSSSKLHFAMKDFPRDYAMQIMLAGIVAVVELWITKGAVEPPEEIARMIHISRQVAPYEFLK